MGRKTKMNSITSDELLSQVNPKNMELLRDFLGYLRSVGRSETTIAGYESDIKIVWVWNLQYNSNKFFVDWAKRNVVLFQDWLINNNENSPARVRRLKSSLSSLSNYIENILDEEFPGFRNIINKIESPVNQPVREKIVWTDEELRALLSYLTAQGDYEKVCFLALAMYSGRRKSELCRFKVSDFDDSRLVCDGALYKSAPIKTKGQGGGKIIPCYTLAKNFKPYFDMWMKQREDLGIESEWLFPQKGKPQEHIPISTVNSWANIFSRISGKSFYPYALRHFHTTSLVKAGIPDNVITQIVGWESADMCKIYTDIDVDEQIGMYFKDGEIITPEKKSLGEI